MLDLFALAGLPLRIDDHGLILDGSIAVEETAVRRLSELAPVAEDPTVATGDRIQYWMYNGVAATADLPRLGPLPMRYELTVLADRPIGRERPKSLGHVHVGGYPEVCEVLAGTAGFLVQDLLPGPRATFAALVTVRPGERIILPPILHHGTISLAGDPLVFSDVIHRRSSGEYATIAAARGLAWFIDISGTAFPNPHYAGVPPLQRMDAIDWSGTSESPLYSAFVDDPSAFNWLGDPDRYRARFPALADRMEPVLAALPADL
jgi:glucose-6-phosphate isomerase